VSKKIQNKQRKLTIWQKVGMFFYSRKTLTITLWLVLVGYGAFSYTSWMRREGFPSVEVPVGVVQVVAFGPTAADVDGQFTKPLTDALSSRQKVKSSSATTTDQGATVAITFVEGTDVNQELNELKAELDSKLPKTGQLIYVKVEAGKLTNEGDDMLISVHKPGASAVELDKAAASLADKLKKVVPLAESVRPLRLIESLDGLGQQQVRFDRYQSKETGSYQPSSVVAVKGFAGSDQLELYDQVKSALSRDVVPEGYGAEISANFAESIREQVSGLQRNLLEGLIVVLIVSFILISLRGSVITAVAMATTVAVTVGVLNLIGYTINTITLFSLVLCLALIVDDTTIMVEAIDAGLKRGDKLLEVVKQTFKKVARASATGTAVTILAFAPMIFIGGILGKFIRAIPITIIISLLVSLAVSFVFIPIMMRLAYSAKLYKQTKAKTKRKPKLIESFEVSLGEKLVKTMLWSTKNLKRSISLRTGAILLSFGCLILGGFIFSKVEFNIFPSPKDGNELIVSAQVLDRESASITKTEQLTDQALEIIKVELGENLEKLSLWAQNGPASRDGFTAGIILTPYGKRSETSVQLAEKLQENLEGSVPGLRIKAESAGVGPPAGGFRVELKADDLSKSYLLAADLQDYLTTKKLERLDGSTARLVDVRITPTNLVSRTDGKRTINIDANFEDKDTSALVSLAQKAVEDDYDANRLADEFKLPADTIGFDFGQEEENQESFASMGKAAGPLFLAMFLLMAVLFRSISQPLLIFSALPFAFLGVAVGLFVTNNPISFFSMLGVFALIGISLNNTILLTDYANQSQELGLTPAKAMAEALRARLRPLLTTSITSVLALLPLALNDPFWEGLAFALIFGLVSSTLLVLLVFPYFYLTTQSISSLTTSLFKNFFARIKARQ
jgi:multidrug efflux pump subunit AcrB